VAEIVGRQITAGEERGNIAAHLFGGLADRFLGALPQSLYKNGGEYTPPWQRKECANN